MSSFNHKLRATKLEARHEESRTCNPPRKLACTEIDNLVLHDTLDSADCWEDFRIMPCGSQLQELGPWTRTLKLSKT